MTLVQASPPLSAQPSAEDSAWREKAQYQAIQSWLQKNNAALIAHYYTSDILQNLCEESGGFVGDSLEMARFGQASNKSTLLVAGVRFMGESAKILSPEKSVFMLDIDAECSLDLMCDLASFKALRAAHPNRVAVVYANTSAAVKAESDWVVTSSIAKPIVAHLHKEGKPILFAPDKHLGRYIQSQTGADMLIWDGACLVHEEFNAKHAKKLKQTHPDAKLLAHPESPEALLKLADFIGSTTQMIEAAKSIDAPQLIIATEVNIFHKMQKVAPKKQLIPVITNQKDGLCRSCARCPWMALNDLAALANLCDNLDKGVREEEIHLDASLIKNAHIPLQRMLDFAKEHAAK